MENNTITWLVVEDDHAIRDIIVTMCELWEFDVIAFKDGYEADDYLNQADPGAPYPDIALLDIRMPGPWGHEIGAKIRQHPRLKDIGIILMTAYELVGADQDEYVQSANADALLYKPLPPMDELLATVNGIIDKRSHELT